MKLYRAKKWRGEETKLLQERSSFICICSNVRGHVGLWMEDKTEEGDEEFREQGGDLTLWEYSIWGFVNKAFNVSPFIDKEKK